MALDPLSALSVAASVVQFVDFSTKIVSKGKQLYKSTHGALSENVELEAASMRLERLTVPIKNSLYSTSQRPLLENEQALEDICNGCVEVSNELVLRLKELKVPVGHKHPKWKSLRQALKSVWSEAEIEKIEDRLAKFQVELDTHLLIELRDRVDILLIRQEEGFKSLDNTKRKIIEALVENRKASYDDTVEQLELGLLQSLRFPTMTHRHEAISEAHQRTFEWIFCDPNAKGKPWSNFVEWLETGHGIYWITGKAGSGKSTLMRFIVDRLETYKYLDIWAQSGCLELPAFFFWNGGVVEQKSHTGLLRSLLFEVLYKHRDLIPAVFPNEWDSKLSLAKREIPIAFDEWSLSRLKKSFERLIGHASERLKLCFFIDGLDEYDGDYEEIAEYFTAFSSSPFVKFCISSRPEPAFTDAFKSWPKLRLQDLTSDDIRYYIEDKFQNNRRMILLTQREPHAAAMLVEEVKDRADGVFLWVALVVKELLKGLTNKDGISLLMKRLWSLPANLEVLYDHMLSSIESIYIEQGSKIFQLRNAEKYELDIETLYHALKVDLLGTLAAPILEKEKSSATPVYTFDIDSHSDHLYKVYDADSLIEYIDTILQTRCSGLMEIHEGKVEYIHRTARDYIKDSLVWNSLLAHTSYSADNRFQPNMALLMSDVIHLKRGQLWFSPGHTLADINKFWFSTSLSLRANIEASNSEVLILLLDEFDRVATKLARMTCPNEEPQLVPGQHWTNFGQPDTWQTSFLSAAAQNGLWLYVKTKVALDSSLVLCKSGIPLLAFALLFTCFSVSTLECLRIIEFLLEQGTDPNEICEGHTLWQYWCYLNHRRTAEHYLDFKGADFRPAIKKIFRMMLKRSVNLNVCCPRKLRFWQVNHSYVISYKPMETECGKRDFWDVDDSELSSLANSAESEHFEKAHSLESVIKDIFKTEKDPQGADELLELIAILKA